MHATKLRLHVYHGNFVDGIPCFTARTYTTLLQGEEPPRLDVATRLLEAPDTLVHDATRWSNVQEPPRNM